MVKRMISPKDLEKLSAYLDDQLKSTERVQLQNRLRQDKELQESLISLQRTRALLRSLPIRKAPRNFTLSAKMVQVERTPFYRPAFGMVSALALLLLLFVLMSDYLYIPEYIGMFPVSKALEVNEEIAAVEAVPEAETLIFPTDSPASAALAAEESLEMPVEEPLGIGGGAAQTGEGDPAEQRLMGTQEPPMMEAAPSAADELPPTDEPMMFKSAAESSSEEGDSQMLESQAASTEAALVPDEKEAVGSTVESSQTAELERIQSKLWIQWILWLVEILLLIIAVGSGIVMVLMRLRNRT